MATRIGVDIGGTFTDLVYYDDATGETGDGKVLTVPHMPEEGVVSAIRGHVPRDVLKRAEFFLHGTTVGLNALLERRGAKVGLIATQGFRDVLEIRRAKRAELYNIFWHPHEPLVPRHLRMEAPERIRADGVIHRPLDEQAMVLVIEQMIRADVDSVAVCLMNSYVNPTHELQIESLLRKAGYPGGISLSHRISGEYREYERTSTTVVDAFVRARMSTYLQRLDERLRELGFQGSSLITRSGSGSMTFSEAQARPFETIMSGPVAGAEGAGELARALNIPALITADVGGTSFDTALILGGRPQLLYEGTVNDMPLQTAWVDVRSIGAGGGSIAFIDTGGLMRVGPRSAAAVPGPASYGRGGTEPAMTDAAAFLGMLGPGRLASGINLDFGRAKAALETISASIQRDAEGTATGIMRIAAASMANAMRDLALDQGLDLREMALVPFGGAGPLMATLLADELEMSRIVVPVLAGNFSASGLLGADMVQSAARTHIMPLSDASLKVAETLVSEMFAAISQRGGHLKHQSEKLARIDLRYKGQEHWLTLELPFENGRITIDARSLKHNFDTEYERTFGGKLSEDVQIVSVRPSVRVPLPPRKVSKPAPVKMTGRETWETYSFRLGKRVTFGVVPRGSIEREIAGPAIVTENTATLYLDAGWKARTGARGELNLTLETRN